MPKNQPVRIIDQRRSAATGSGGNVVLPGHNHDHGALTGLADDDHEQYLLANGERSLSGDLDFDGYRAIAMVCDNGTSFPIAAVDAQWFFRSDQAVLYIYESGWKPIISFGDLSLYVDGTLGADAAGKGYASGVDACATLAYAWTLVPGIFGGNVTINMAAGNYEHPEFLGGKNPSGDFSITILGATEVVLSDTSPTSTTGGNSTTNATMTISSASWGIGIVKDSGTNTSTSSGKLVQSGQDFLATVKKGMQVKNLTDNAWAHVTAVDSDAQLSLDADIFTGTGKSFEVGWGQFKGHFIQFADDTITAGLQGQTFTIYEHNSTVLTNVGRFRALATYTPSASDVFRIVKPATVFTTGNAPTIAQNNIIYRAVELSNGRIWDFVQVQVRFELCWMGQVTLRFGLSSVVTDACYTYNRLGSYTLVTFEAASSTKLVPQKHLWNFSEFGSAGLTVQNLSTIGRDGHRFCNIIENCASVALSVGPLAFAALLTSAATETGWQFYRNTTALVLAAFSTASTTTNIYSGNTTDVRVGVLPGATVFAITNATAPAAATDTTSFWAADQQSRAGDSALHVLGEAGKTYSFGAQAQLGGGLALPIATKTASATLTLSESTVLCNATSGAITLTLPTAASAYNSATGVGQIYAVKKIDSSANTVTVDGNGAETIDGAATQVLAAQWAVVRIQSNGSAWYII